MCVCVCRGWLVGVDEYYVEYVQYILDTAVEELAENPDRQFMYVEQVRSSPCVIIVSASHKLL